MAMEDGYDHIRAAYNAGAAAVMSKLTNQGSSGPDVEAYVEQLKREPLVARLTGC